MIDKTVVVGHAPTLIGAGKGEYIDSFNSVIRIPIYGDWQTPEDYGVRISYYCGTPGNIREKRKSIIPDYGFFIWDKRKERVDKDSEDLIVKYGGSDISGLVAFWRKRLPKKRKHYHFDTGTVSICAAAAILKKDVVAVGCDFLRDGRTDRLNFFGSPQIEGRVISRHEIKKRCGKHPWKESRALIDIMAKEYGVRIEFE